MKQYRKRIVDEILSEKLEGKGTVLIEGPKWCGKTTTAEQMAASVLYMDDSKSMEQNINMASVSLYYPIILLNLEQYGITANQSAFRWRKVKAPYKMNQDGYCYPFSIQFRTVLGGFSVLTDPAPLARLEMVNLDIRLSFLSGCPCDANPF